MAVEVKIPDVGESIHEVQIAQWLKSEGAWVERDEEIVELDTDKATVQVPSPAAGRLARIVKREGEMAEVGELIAELDEKAKKDESSSQPSKKETVEAASDTRRETTKKRKTKSTGKAQRDRTGDDDGQRRSTQGESSTPKVMPAAQRLLEEHQLSADQIRPSGPGGRLLKEDVLAYLERLESESESGSSGGHRQEEIVPMTMIRRRIAQRLVEAQRNAALLTTYNEVDMTGVKQLRSRYRETFREKYDVDLGFMSFFVRASLEALKRFPAINAEIRGTDIVYRNYFDIGIAIGSGKGLVVPVLRDADQLSFAEIEQSIGMLAEMAKRNQLKPEQLEGGTFTISNGGVYGSLLSTPIVNPPQSGILGMHTIQDRPVAREGQVVIRPMMYLALTYDHRIVDGREAVTFLRHIKDVLEDPARILLEV